MSYAFSPDISFCDASRTYNKTINDYSMMRFDMAYFHFAISRAARARALFLTRRCLRQPDAIQSSLLLISVTLLKIVATGYAYNAFNSSIERMGKVRWYSGPRGFSAVARLALLQLLGLCHWLGSSLPLEPPSAPIYLKSRYSASFGSHWFTWLSIYYFMLSQIDFSLI